MITYRRLLLPLIISWLWCGPAGWLQGSTISPAGEELARALDSMHVEKLWLAGARVDWRTGEPVGKASAQPNGHTHCSAFAAAAAEKLGVYSLHPPAHSSASLVSKSFQNGLPTRYASGTHETHCSFPDFGEPPGAGRPYPRAAQVRIPG